MLPLRSLVKSPEIYLRQFGEACLLRVTEENRRGAEDSAPVVENTRKEIFSMGFVRKHLFLPVAARHCEVTTDLRAPADGT